MATRTAPTTKAPWTDVFQISGPEGFEPSGAITLEQCDAKRFALRSTVVFKASQATGLEGKVSPEAVEAIRTVTPDDLPFTDLASVPVPLQWLVSRYGVYTPAALIHDRLIGDEAPRAGVFTGLTDAYADRYFRFMLDALGVRWLRRWMMWSAVALRTRWGGGLRKQIMLAVWTAAALAGIAAAIIGLVTQTWWLVIVAGLAPFAFSFLWEEQYGAGLVASYTAAWVLPPTALGAVGYWIYAALEQAAGLFRRGKGEDQPVGYEHF